MWGRRQHGGVWARAPLLPAAAPWLLPASDGPFLCAQEELGTGWGGGVKEGDGVPAEASEPTPQRAGGLPMPPGASCTALRAELYSSRSRQTSFKPNLGRRSTPHQNPVAVCSSEQCFIIFLGSFNYSPRICNYFHALIKTDYVAETAFSLQ